MMKLNFTQKAIDALPIPDKRTLYYDTGERGLVLIVYPTGRKSFYFYKKVQGKPTQVKIGDHPHMSVTFARQEAKKKSVAAQEGEPVVRKKPDSERTFEDLYRWWLEHHSKPRNKTSWQDERRYACYLTGLGQMKLSKVTKAEVRSLIQDVAANHGESTANKCLTQIQSIYTQAMYNDLWEGLNPSVGIRRFPEVARDRRLTSEEVKRFMEAVATEPDPTIKDIVLMLLYTGQRRGNVLAMRWDQLDLTHRLWRIPETKNGKPHVVPLEDAEVQLLKERLKKTPKEEEDTPVSPWVFPGRTGGKTGHIVEIKKSWEKLLLRAKLKKEGETAEIRIHDLRRTLGSWMVDTGASLHVVGQTLAHQNTQTTAIYARLALDPVREAKRKALAAIEEAARSPEE